MLRIFTVIFLFAAHSLSFGMNHIPHKSKNKQRMKEMEAIANRLYRIAEIRGSFDDGSYTPLQMVQNQRQALQIQSTAIHLNMNALVIRTDEQIKDLEKLSAIDKELRDWVDAL